MTIAEVSRAIESRVRVKNLEAKEKATYDYILADLIGRSVGRVYSSSVQMPSINDAYPSLFQTTEAQEKQQKAKQELSAIRFKQFADSFNKRFIK